MTLSSLKITTNKHFHFIGIGGIGMSALALILREQGHYVSGCDTSTYNTNLDRLKKHGCSIYHEHSTNHLLGVDALIYSTAISPSNSERMHATNVNIPQLHRAQLLNMLMHDMTMIAITGSHGKTTTTSLLAHIFIQAQQDPSVICGGIINSLDSNAHYGTGKIAIVEADESDKSLSYLHPTQALITNTDSEHLNVYTDLNEIKDTFIAFAHQTPHDGIVYLGIDDEPTKDIAKKINRNTITFGEDSASDFQAHTITYHPHQTSFFITNYGRFTIHLAGKHNMLNALGAVSIALTNNIPIPTIQKALHSFSGVHRRCEFKGTYNGAHLYDDYAHHPTELEHILNAAHRFAPTRLFAAFQPQRYTRTKDLWDKFVSTLAQAKVTHLFIVDIHPAHEQPIDSISSKNLVAAIQQKNSSCTISYIASDDELYSTIRSLLKKEDTFISLGAGKLHLITEKIAKSSS